MKCYAKRFERCLSVSENWKFYKRKIIFFYNLKKKEYKITI